MKTFWAIVLASILAGCSMFASRSYDAMEYTHVVNVAVDATKIAHQCSEPQANYFLLYTDLDSDSIALLEYESHINGNAKTLAAATQIRKLVNEFEPRRLNGSPRYCLHKSAEIQSASRTLARSLGGLNKFNICDSDVTTRYGMYEKSFKDGKISKGEFTELTQDLVDLGTIDEAACSVENRVKFNQALELIQKAAAAAAAL